MGEDLPEEISRPAFHKGEIDLEPEDKLSGSGGLAEIPEFF